MRLAYLSGAPRVSTAVDADAPGPRAHILGMISGFERAGWRVDRYIAGDTSSARFIAGKGREVLVQRSRWRPVVADAVRIGAASLNLVAARRAIRGAVDLAYERFGSYQALGRAFQRRGVPWVLETSGPFFHEAKVERATLALSTLARRRELWAYRTCDLLICVSAPLRDYLVEAGVPGDRTLVLPNAVDIALFDPAAYHVPERDVLTVGFVGSVLRWQGLDSLIRSVVVARRRGVPVRLEVVGDGPALPALRELARQTDGKGAIRFVGPLDAMDVPAAIARFDLGYVGHVPTLDGRMYHSPLKLYEYGAMGVAPLAAAHDEARAFVSESGHGYLFGDAQALVDVLEHAAGVLEDIRRARGAVRKYVVERHSWDHRVRRLLAELAKRGLVCE